MTGINYWDEMLHSGGTDNTYGQISVFCFNLKNAGAVSIIEDSFTGKEYALTSLQHGQ
ncbi:MAG: hypothetical protein J6M93_02020 [Succinivibrio sp.]|nr:hypothetical protein [Succinivibrio sp.]